MAFISDECALRGHDLERRRTKKTLIRFESGVSVTMTVMLEFMVLFAEISTRSTVNAAAASLGPPAPGSGATRPPSHWRQPQQYQQVLSSLWLKNYTTSSSYFADLLPFLYPDSTLFVPTNEAFLGLSVSPISLTVLLSYHVVTQQYSFEQIQALPLDTRLPTVLTSTILITGVAKDDFRVDNVRIVEGDVCTSNTTVLQFSCHGVEAILNASQWGTAANSSSLTLPPAPSVTPEPILAPAPIFSPPYPAVAPSPTMTGVPPPSVPPLITGNPPLSTPPPITRNSSVSNPPAVTGIPPPSDPPSVISIPPPLEPATIVGVPSTTTSPPPSLPPLPSPNAFVPTIAPVTITISGGVTRSPYCRSSLVVLTGASGAAVLLDWI